MTIDTSPSGSAGGQRRRSDTAEPPAPARGRPRSERATAAILDAARELLEAHGLRRLSVDAIAARAGVSKATIYRWWPSKAAVVMDAFLAGTGPRMPFPDTGSAREDLRRQLRSVIRLFNEPRTRDPFVALIAESQHDPELARALRERFIASRRAAAREVFVRGKARGELRDDLDVEIAIDALYGALYYRLLVSGEPLRPRYADALLDQLYPPALAAAPRSRRRREGTSRSQGSRP